MIGGLLGLLGAGVALCGCSNHAGLAPPAAPLSQPTQLCMENTAPPTCRSASQVEQLLAGDVRILSMDDTPGGSQGAKLLTLRGTLQGQSVTFRAKWRPQSSAGLINEPRKELAAYAVQKLFLDDDQLVVPPTVARCFPLADYRRFMADEQPTFAGVDCVLGFASYWLEGVKTVEAARDDGWLPSGDGILDKKLFESDPLYAASLARANLLTYAINHGDAHGKQFLLERTPRGLRTYIADNSIALRSIKNPMLLVREDWSQIQVPRLDRKALARLRALTDRDLSELATVELLELQRGQLLPTQQPEAPVGGTNEMSWAGKYLRIGLTKGERELVASRIHELLARSDLEQPNAP